MGKQEPAKNMKNTYKDEENKRQEKSKKETAEGNHVEDLQQPDHWTSGNSEADRLAKCCAKEYWESHQL